jgi:multiple sugar transport system substrate-binding protein
MKKLPYMLCVLILLVGSVAACSGASTPATQPPVIGGDVATEVAVAPTEAAPQTIGEQVTLAFWHTYNEDSSENKMLTQTLIPMFEAKFPNIKIESFTKQWPDFMRDLTTQIAAGVAPDLIRSDIVWVPQLADMGALVPLDSAMPDFNELKNAMFPGPLSTNLWKGTYYGLPLDTNTKVWIYNPDMYAKAGIQNPAASISDLLNECQAFKSVYPNAYFLASSDVLAWSITPWIWSMGGEILSPDLTTATGYLNGPKTVAAYELYLKLFQEGCIAPLVLGNGEDAYAGLAKDLYASRDDGPWTYPIVDGQAQGKKLSAVLFPAGEAGSIDVVGGEDIVLFKQSKHPQEAMEFIRFMVSEEAQLKMAEVGVMPVLSSLAEADAIKNNPTFPIFMEQLKTSKARPSLPQWNEIDTIIGDAGQRILREEMTPQQSLDQAAAEIDKLINP